MIYYGKCNEILDAWPLINEVKGRRKRINKGRFRIKIVDIDNDIED